MLAIGLAGRRTGRLNCLVNDLGVSLGGDHFLRNGDLITDGAVLAFGQTSLSAGWSLCCIDYFCVAGRGDFFHTGENRITNGALRTGRMTSLGAGSGLFRNFNQSMSSRVDCFGLGCIANCAGGGLDAGILTGRRGRDLALIPAVALGGNLFLCNEDFVTDGAVLAFRQAGRSAGRLDCLINHFRVTLRGNSFLRGNHLTADRALLSVRQTSFRTGRCLTGNLLCLMAGCWNFLLRNDDRMTDGAVLAFRLARLRAGRLDCRINHFRVTSLCKLSLFRCCASITGARFLARCCAACGSCYCPFAPAVA